MRSMLLSAVVGMGVLALPSAARADDMRAAIRVVLPADAGTSFPAMSWVNAY